MFTIIFSIVIVLVYLLDTFVVVPKGIPIFTKEHIWVGDKQGYFTKALKLSEEKIKKGQVWRLFTQVFLHVGVFHILMNVGAMLIVGLAVEEMLGWWKTLLCFVGSSFISALCMAFGFKLNDGEGASTGIYGLIAVFLLLAIKNGTILFSAMPWYLLILLAIYTVGGMFMDKTTSWEHVTGFIGGLLVGSLFVFI